MPKELEDKLRKEAREKGYAGKRADRYVYGTLNKIETKGKYHCRYCKANHLLSSTIGKQHRRGKM